MVTVALAKPGNGGRRPKPVPIRTVHPSQQPVPMPHASTGPLKPELDVEATQRELKKARRQGRTGRPVFRNDYWI